VEENIMEKLSEEKGSASIRRPSSKAGEPLEGFKEYRESEDAKNLSEKNKENAEKKKYHHKLGQGLRDCHAKVG
jgi:hypothetical protein